MKRFDPNSTTERYWEAKKIALGANGTHVDDTDGLEDHPDTAGSQSTHGKVKIFPNSSEYSKEINRWGKGSVAAAGSLPATSDQPSFWNNPSLEGGSRDTSVNWECCEGNKWHMRIKP